jgi:hypothetical protein
MTIPERVFNFLKKTPESRIATIVYLRNVISKDVNKLKELRSR